MNGRSIEHASFSLERRYSAAPGRPRGGPVHTYRGPGQSETRRRKSAKPASGAWMLRKRARPGPR